jgi:O-antigen/teichoic acid export membrane protein
LKISKLKSLKNHQGFKKYFENTSWLLSEKILKIISELMIGIWIARYLGPENFGLLSYSQSFAGLFMVVATMGLNNIIVREIAADHSKRDLILGTSFVIQIFGATLVLLLLLVSINFADNDSSTNTLILIIAFSVVFKSLNVVDFYFQSQVLGRYIAYSNIFMLICASIIKVLLILVQAPLIYFAYILLFESFLLALGFIYFYSKQNISILNWRFDKKKAISLLKDGWPLILSGFIISVYMKVDQIMIKEMLNSAAVGQYAAAVKLSEAGYFIAIVVASSLFPAIINARKRSKQLYYERLQKMYDLMVWMAIIIALPVSVMSDWVVNLLYGEQYNEAAIVLALHIWSGVFVYLGVASGKWFICENLQILLFRRALYGVIVNIGLNIILIPKYGIQGAAISTLLSQIMSAYLSDLLNKKTRKVFIMKTKSFNIFRIISSIR